MNIITGNGPAEKIHVCLGIALLTVVTGCTGYVGGGYGGGGGYVGGGYGGAVVVAQPDVYLYGGSYERRQDVHVYSNRGVESRAVVHSGSVHSGHTVAVVHNH
jgi:hypothetical protein